MDERKKCDGVMVVGGLEGCARMPYGAVPCLHTARSTEQTKTPKPQTAHGAYTYHERVDEQILEPEERHGVLHLEAHHEGLEEVGPLLDGARLGGVLRGLELCVFVFWVFRGGEGMAGLTIVVVGYWWPRRVEVGWIHICTYR